MSDLTKLYEVTFITYDTFIVEATNEDEAFDVAEERANYPLYDDVEIEEIEERAY